MDDLKPINFYDLLDDDLKAPQRTYDNYDRLHLDLPTRAVVCGSSGSGKTLAVFNLIRAFKCFDKFYLYVDPSDKLYQQLIRWIENSSGNKEVVVSDNIADLPSVEDIDDSLNNLFIIDDQLTNTKGPASKNLVDIYTKGRRRNASVIYITQDFFSPLVPYCIRKNSKVIILTRFDDEKDLDNILNKYRGSWTPKQMKAIYNYCVKGDDENDKTHFMLIDTEAPANRRFRRDFTPLT